MATVEFAPAVSADFDRIFDHLAQFDVTDAPARIAEIVAALAILEHSPSIGRPAGPGLRELVIGRRSRGYVALYRFVPELDTVHVLAIRSQREVGYRDS